MPKTKSQTIAARRLACDALSGESPMWIERAILIVPPSLLLLGVILWLCRAHGLL